MAKNSQTPLVSFEDLRPYVKLVGKNWWLLVGLAIVGYAGGRLVTHQMVDIHKATSEILVNQKESTGVDAMLGGRGGGGSAPMPSDSGRSGGPPQSPPDEFEDDIPF